MKLKETIWGVLALFPWIVIFLAIVTHIIFELPSVVNLSLFGLILYILIAIILLVIWIVFTIHAWKNKYMFKEEQSKWALLIFFLSIYAYPIYWWKYIRKPSLLYTDAMFTGELGELQKELTELALGIAREFYDINLDFTHKSINDVENILADIHKQYKETGKTEGLNGIALEFGSYIAATIQKNTNAGELKRHHPTFGADSFPFYLQENIVFTYGWCEKRIFDGEGDDIVSKYKVLVLDKI